MAFLKFIYHNNCALAPDWANDPVRRYRSATIAEKNRFCLEQAIIISYLDYIYGSGMELFQQYRKFFTSWYLAELRDLASTATDPFTKANYINCAILLRLMPGKIDSTHAIRLLSDETVCPGREHYHEDAGDYRECDEPGRQGWPVDASPVKQFGQPASSDSREYHMDKVQYEREEGEYE